MTNPEITAKAIQAAHAAICEQNIDDCLDPDWRGKCVKAVEAAAPCLQVAAWHEGCKAGLSTNPGWEDEAIARNPYRTTK